MMAGCDSHSEPRRTGRSSASGRTISESFALKLAAAIVRRTFSPTKFTSRYGQPHRKSR
jgi:hypothetical protein